MLYFRWPAFLVAVALCAAPGCDNKSNPPRIAAVPRVPPDLDGDGVIDDGTDRCLDEKEDGLPPKPHDGCRSSDSDQDGIPDNGADHCITEREDGKPPDPVDGCPSTDRDWDGIANKLDRCPDEPETRNDFEDEDGCPDTAPRVRVTRSEVKISEKILFAFGKATIEPQSDGLLDEIATVIDANPQIEFVEVAGHADKVGTDPANVQLTRQRAHAVLEGLAKRGIQRSRLRALGYGRYCNVDPGDSEPAREKNRRVEFKILRIDGVETGVALGCEHAVAHGLRAAGVPKTAPRREEIAKASAARGPLALVGPRPAPPKTTPQPAPAARPAKPAEHKNAAAAFGPLKAKAKAAKK